MSVPEGAKRGGGRPSKLTTDQWEEIQRRLLAGEKAADLAREFGVSPARISNKFADRTEKLRSVASKLAEAQAAVKTLPFKEQKVVYELADDLQEISRHVAGAARFGAATAHRLAGMAHEKVQQIDDAAPLDAKNLQALKDVAVLTRLANDASQIPLNLLAANREAMKGGEGGKGLEKALSDVIARLPA